MVEDCVALLDGGQGKHPHPDVSVGLGHGRVAWLANVDKYRVVGLCPTEANPCQRDVYTISVRLNLDAGQAESLAPYLALTRII